MEYPAWLRGWKGAVIWSAAGLVVLYGLYAAFVSYDNGTDVDLHVEVGTYTDSGTHGGASMYLRCASGSTPSVCSPGDSTFRVHKRDRIHLTVTNLDGGDHTHDIRLTGGAYWLWPAGFEDELNGCASSKPCAETTFVAYSTGSFRIVCELTGHDGAGMNGTLVVS